MTTTRHGAKVYLDPDMMEFLRAESERRRIPWAQIIRELVLQEMKRRKAVESRSTSGNASGG